MMLRGVLCAALAAASCSALAPIPPAIVLDNGIVSVTFDTAHPSITSLKCRGKETLAGSGFGLRLEVQDEGGVPSPNSAAAGKGTAAVHSSSDGPSPDLTVEVVRANEVVRVGNVVDRADGARVTETWTLSLAPNDAFLTLNITGHLLQSSSAAATKQPPVSVRHSVYTVAQSVTGFYR